jgi:hypothetical protein
LPESAFLPLFEVLALVLFDDAELLWVVGDEVVEGAPVVGAAAGVGAALGAAAVGAAAASGQDSDSERIGSFRPGSDRSVNGVPTGTSIVKGIWMPPSSVTVTTHCWSADADGIAATANPADMAPAAANAPIILRLLNTVAYLLPLFGRLRKSSALPSKQRGVHGTHWREGLQRRGVSVVYARGHPVYRQEPFEPARRRPLRLDCGSVRAFIG